MFISVLYLIILVFSLLGLLVILAATYLLTTYFFILAVAYLLTSYHIALLFTSILICFASHCWMSCTCISLCCSVLFLICYNCCQCKYSKCIFLCSSVLFINYLYNQLPIITFINLINYLYLSILPGNQMVLFIVVV